MTLLLELAAVGCLIVLMVPRPLWIRRHWRMTFLVPVELSLLIAYRKAYGLP